MLLEPPDRERGFKRERLLRLLLTHPNGDLNKWTLARKAETSDGLAVKFTNQLKDKGLVEGTTVRDLRGLYDYWRDTRPTPSTVTGALQSPVDWIQEADLTHAFTI